MHVCICAPKPSLSPLSATAASPYLLLAVMSCKIFPLPLTLSAKKMIRVSKGFPLSSRQEVNKQERKQVVVLRTESVLNCAAHFVWFCSGACVLSCSFPLCFEALLVLPQVSTDPASGVRRLG